MLSDRVFQSILPLNDRELCPHEDALAFGIWRRFFIHAIPVRKDRLSWILKQKVDRYGEDETLENLYRNRLRMTPSLSHLL